jgi:hypothetical protein
MWVATWIKPDGSEGRFETDDEWAFLTFVASRAIEQAGVGPATAAVEVTQVDERQWVKLTMTSTAADPPDDLDFAVAADSAVEELVNGPHGLGFTDHPGLGLDHLSPCGRAVAVRMLARTPGGSRPE